MSVTGTSGSSAFDPAAYTYTPQLPTGLERGSAKAPGPVGVAAATTADGSTSGTAANPYQQQYANLVRYDAQELIAVSTASPSDAESNVASVLAQAAAYQAAQREHPQLDASAAQAATLAPTGSANDPLNIPTSGELQAQNQLAELKAIDDQVKALQSGFSTLA